MVRTVADQFAEVLAAACVKRIYGIVGESLNGLTDSLRRKGGMEWIPGRCRRQPHGTADAALDYRRDGERLHAVQ
jgi:thiamine pyrophosphate-dependent acetolactate synthase large subunit-like protein